MGVLGLTQRMSLLASTDNQWTPAVLWPTDWYDASDLSTVTVGYNGATNVGGLLPWSGAQFPPHGWIGWLDKSGNGRYSTFSTLGNNANPIALVDRANARALRFWNGGYQWAAWVGTSHIQTQSWCVCVMFYRRTSSSNTILYPGSAKIWGFWNGGWQMNDFMAPATTYTADKGEFAIFESNASTPQRLIRVNGGESTATSNTVESLGSTMAISGWGNSNFSSSNDIGEILIFNRPLMLTEKQQVEGYFAHKWAATGTLPSGHPYKTSPPTL